MILASGRVFNLDLTRTMISHSIADQLPISTDPTMVRDILIEWTHYFMTLNYLASVFFWNFLCWWLHAVKTYFIFLGGQGLLTIGC